MTLTAVHITTKLVILIIPVNQMVRLKLLTKRLGGSEIKTPLNKGFF